MNEEQARSAGVDLINRSDDEDDVRLGCSSDSKEFNFNNHLIMSGENNDEFSFSPLSFFVARNQSKSSENVLRKRSSTNWMEMFDGLFSRSESSSEIESRDLHSEELSKREEINEDDSRYVYSLPNYFSKRQGAGDVLDGGSSTNDSFINDIGSTSGCPSTSMVVYVGVAADCTYSALNSSTGGTRSQILQDMNSVSNLYRSTFNVSIGVVDMDVRDPTCPSSPSSDAPWNVGCDGNSPSLDQRLSDFSSWRGNRDANGTGLWHLLTTCNSGSEVGVAWLGKCRESIRIEVKVIVEITLLLSYRAFLTDFFLSIPPSSPLSRRYSMPNLCYWPRKQRRLWNWSDCCNFERVANHRSRDGTQLWSYPRLRRRM